MKIPIKIIKMHLKAMPEGKFTALGDCSRRGKATNTGSSLKKPEKYSQVNPKQDPEEKIRRKIIPFKIRDLENVSVSKALAFDMRALKIPSSELT